MNWISHANEAEDPKSIEETRRIYSRGTYLEIIEFRARELPRDLAPDTEDAYLSTIFLLGLYAGRRRIFHDISGHLPFIRRGERGGVVIGIAGKAAFAAVGRMALSNYLLQSLICTTIFYGYGLALFGKVRPSLGLLLTTIICLIQIPLSVWWLRRFRFGPIEWLWRSLTYGQRQPMRVDVT